MIDSPLLWHTAKLGLKRKGREALDKGKTTSELSSGKLTVVQLSREALEGEVDASRRRVAEEWANVAERWREEEAKLQLHLERTEVEAKELRERCTVLEREVLAKLSEVVTMLSTGDGPVVQSYLAAVERGHRSLRAQDELEGRRATATATTTTPPMAKESDSTSSTSEECSEPLRDEDDQSISQYVAASRKGRLRQEAATSSIAGNTTTIGANTFLEGDTTDRVLLSSAGEKLFEALCDGSLSSGFVHAIEAVLRENAALLARAIGCEHAERETEQRFNEFLESCTCEAGERENNGPVTVPASRREGKRKYDSFVRRLLTPLGAFDREIARERSLWKEQNTQLEEEKRVEETRAREAEDAWRKTFGAEKERLERMAREYREENEKLRQLQATLEAEIQSLPSSSELVKKTLEDLSCLAVSLRKILMSQTFEIGTVYSGNLRTTISG